MVSDPAQAHTSEGGFVLLLPTDFYIASGVFAVALTVAFMAFLPSSAAVRIFTPLRLWRSRPNGLPRATSLVSAAVLMWLVYVGLNGSRDPLANPLPLTIWTVWWVGLVFVQGFVVDLWRWINPWTGPVWVLQSLMGRQSQFRLSPKIGHSLGVVSFLGFVAFLLADIAPSDPARLARAVAAYWLLHLIGNLLFGHRWALRAEGIGMVMQLYARLAPFGRSAQGRAFGFWGWQTVRRRVVSPGLALLCLLVLGSGSFDGVNETFWWLAQLGLNPLEFPGRSAVIWQTLVGLMASNVLLVAIFAATLWLGLRLGRVTHVSLATAFCLFAPTVLPIALGYHFAHYFTSFLVEAQYVRIALTDPWSRGQDFLGLGQIYVTTGFFNTQDSVRVLWLCQAGGVVIGHIVAVLLAHAVAVRHFGSARTALLSQVPLAIFMICYTFFGLWLLASPRGF
ncbi:hypothetical protein [uncultured Shimia sp.]|uniref:hypothetical protein n=1 Tax=uncultured Shimia sp. TaxID=573152 RepID=UPI00262753EF|nr:hypothetical protein [uncultured Shimia sp.]